MGKFRLLITVTAIACLFGSCTSASSDTDPDPGPDTPEPDPTSNLDCEREGYPCRLTDVPKEVFDASVQALEDAYDALDAGDLADARALLESRDDLVAIHSDGNSIHFRLEGGSPVWLVDVTDLLPDESSPAVPNVGTGVVGDDTNSDGSEDNRDDKRALVMAPYYWQFNPYDESPILAERLELLPGYEGNVRYVSNPKKEDQNVTLDDWASWDNYDGIFVSTHGKRLTVGGEERVVISSGVFVKYDNIDSAQGALLKKVYARNRQSTFEYIQYGLSMDYFRGVYPSGLDDAIVVFASCETGAVGANDLADALTGENVVMMGWTEVVYVLQASRTIEAFNESLGLGLPTGKALAKLQEQGLDRGITRDTVLTVFTRFASGVDQRLIEVPTLLDENEKPLKDGTDLSNSLDGTAGDGDPDILTIETQLDGIEEGMESEYRVKYALGGEELPGTYDLSQANRLNETAVTVVHDVDLGRDAPTDPSDLMVIVELPEGGESRYVAEVELLRNCGWSLAFSGPDHNGTYEGIFAATQTTSAINLIHDTTASSFPSIYILTSNPLPTDVPATLKLGLSGTENPENQDGTFEIIFEDANYRSGDGSACCFPTYQEDTFPLPLTFELLVNEPDLVEGKVSGEVWAYSVDGGPPLRKADIQLDFTITTVEPCYISDSTNPF